MYVKIIFPPIKFLKRYAKIYLGSTWVESLFHLTFDGRSTAPKETDSTRLAVSKSTPVDFLGSTLTSMLRQLCISLAVSAKSTYHPTLLSLLMFVQLHVFVCCFLAVRQRLEYVLFRTLSRQLPK